MLLTGKGIYEVDGETLDAESAQWTDVKQLTAKVAAVLETDAASVTLALLTKGSGSTSAPRKVPPGRKECLRRALFAVLTSEDTGVLPATVASGAVTGITITAVKSTNYKIAVDVTALFKWAWTLSSDFDGQ